MIQELRKLKGNEVLVAMVAFLAVVGPGFLTIYHYHPELVKDLDVIKLLLFSASLSCPLIFCNMILFVAGTGKNEPPDRGTMMLVACLYTAPSFYFALAMVWFTHAPFTRMVVYLAGFAVALGIAILASLRAELKLASKKPE